MKRTIQKALLPYSIGFLAVFIALAGVAFGQDMQTSQPPTTAGIIGFINSIKAVLLHQDDATTSAIRPTTPTMDNMSSTTPEIQRILTLQNVTVSTVKIDATAVRLGKILDKLNSRIQKINSTGADTTLAQSEATDAQAHLKSTITDMTNIKTMLSVASSTAPLLSTASSSIKTDSQSAQFDLQTVQNDINSAVQTLESLNIPLPAKENNNQ